MAREPVQQHMTQHDRVFLPTPNVAPQQLPPPGAWLPRRDRQVATYRPRWG